MVDRACSAITSGKASGSRFASHRQKSRMLYAASTRCSSTFVAGTLLGRQTRSGTSFSVAYLQQHVSCMQVMATERNDGQCQHVPQTFCVMSDPTGAHVNGQGSR